MAVNVLNRGIGTIFLSHYCPNCKKEVFNSNTDKNDIKKCEHCGTEIKFPDTSEIMNLLKGD